MATQGFDPVISGNAVDFRTENCRPRGSLSCNVPVQLNGHFSADLFLKLPDPLTAGHYEGSHWTATVNEARHVYLAGERGAPSVFGQWVTVNAVNWEAWLAARDYLLDAGGMKNVATTLEVAKAAIAQATELRDELSQMRNLVNDLAQKVQDLMTPSAQSVPFNAVATCALSEAPGDH